MRRGLATHGIDRRHAAAVDPGWQSEARYWQAQYLYQPYYEPGRRYDFYAPAYQVGYEMAVLEPAGSFDEHATEMQHRLAAMRRHPELDWDRAEPAARAAWLRDERGRRRLA